MTAFCRQHGVARWDGEKRAQAASVYPSIVGIAGGVGGGLGLAGAFVTLWPGDARLEFGPGAILCGGLAAFALLSAAVAHRWVGAVCMGLAVVVFGYALALQGDYDLWVHAFQSAAGSAAKRDVLLASPALLLLQLSTAAVALASAIGLLGQYLAGGTVFQGRRGQWPASTVRSRRPPDSRPRPLQ